MKKILLVIVLIFITNSLYAQTSWTPVAGFPGNPRAWATSFSIGDKGYIGTGGTNYVYNNDLWEYDSSNDTWSQKANVGGILRGSAVGFSVYGKGYLGMGGNSDNQERARDLWEYDPEINKWSFNSLIPDEGLSYAVAFVINDIAYIGTGSTKTIIGNESNKFWEFNPKSKTWIARADVPGEARTRAIGFSSNSKGYMGLGRNNTSGSTSYLYDFYEYDPINDSWTKKSDYPGNSTVDCVFFSLNNYGYAGMGYQREQDLWRYNFETDTWSEVESFWGNGRIAPVSLAINNEGYMGLGYTTNAQGSVDFNDFWKFEDATLGINDVTNSVSKLTLFPNPAGNKLNYIFENKSDDLITSIEVKNIHGQTVLSSLTRNFNKQLDLENLNTGLYFLTVHTINNSMTKRFIKE